MTLYIAKVRLSLMLRVGRFAKVYLSSGEKRNINYRKDISGDRINSKYSDVSKIFV